MDLESSCEVVVGSGSDDGFASGADVVEVLVVSAPALVDSEVFEHPPLNSSTTVSRATKGEIWTRFNIAVYKSIKGVLVR